jgi:hypothetical protein
VTTSGLHDRDCNALYTLGISTTQHFLYCGNDYTFSGHYGSYVCFIQFAVKYLLSYSEDATT